MTEQTKQAIGELVGMLAALEQSRGVRDSTAFTCRELREAANCGESRCRDLIRAGIQAGKILPARKTITDLAGRIQTVPAYEPAERGHVSR